MERASAAIVAKAGRYPRLTALLLGAVAATGFAPLSLWPLALLALAAFVHLVADADGWRRAAALGWCFGFAHFTLGLNWIATAFTYQGNMPTALGWVAVPLLAVYLAVFPAIGCAAAKVIGRHGLAFVAAFAACWTISEWLRSWVFTGFAWNPLGSILLGRFETQGIAALAPYLGTYALSGVAVALAGLFALAIARRRTVPAGFIAAAVAVAMLAPAGSEDAEGALRYTVVQPDLRQPMLDRPELEESNFQRLAQLSAPELSIADDGGPRLIMWPESGMVDLLTEGYPQRYYTRFNYGGDPLISRARIAGIIGPDSLLLTGGTDLEIENSRMAGAYNTVFAVDGDGALRGKYYKAHLVPYGEYLALRWLLEPLGATRLVPGAVDFLPGPGPRTLDLGDYGRAGIQICYEIVFSGQVVDRDDRPDYIFNDSNDGWFGAWGPPQHLAQARLRAIEEGLPVLRSTTTGISAVIDARGIVRDYLPHETAGRMDGIVPPAAAPTAFALYGNTLPLAWAMMALLVSGIVRRRTGS